MYRTPPKRPTSFSPFQKTVVHRKARRQEDAGRPVGRSLWCPPKHTDTTNCFGDSYQEAHSEPLDALPADPPNWSIGTPNALCTWTPHPVAISLYTSQMVAGVSPCRLLVSTCKKTGQALWHWDGGHKLEHFQHCLREKEKTGGCQYLVWLCRIERRHKILRLSSQEETESV